LRTLHPDSPEMDRALEIIGNWRSCHGFPLQVVKMTLKKRACNVNPKPLVAQRIKRLSSIAIKLEQNPTMRLTQMQDIGGCRAVMLKVGEVDKLVKIYEVARAKNPDRGAVLVAKTNYVERPKHDGYRGVHLIMKFQSRGKPEYNGQKIEIQIRSTLQHAWATAVETSQTFTGQALKSKLKAADPKWLRFFALVSSAIAARERMPSVPGTPDTVVERADELRQIDESERIVASLAGWNTAIQHQQVVAPDAFAFLLELDTTKRILNIRPFKESEMMYAQQMYLRKEKETAHQPEIQVVLVSVDSLAALKRAYPNYYMDTTVFVNFIRLELEKSRRNS